jgi:Zn-dependent protease with chaperone function
MRSSVALIEAHRYEQISPKTYEHPADRAATSALHAVPLLDKVIKRLTDLGHERRFRQVLIGNSVRLGEDQLPGTYELYLACVRSFDLPTIPELYVVNNAQVNAMTVGAKTPMVIVNSSLVASYDRGEIQSVLAHESGHVLSEHNYYTTAMVLLSEFIRGTLPRSLLVGLPVRALYLALLEWSRAAELSADRASAIIMGDPQQPCRMLMCLASGALPDMDFDAFMRQATGYVDEEDLFSRHARFWVELSGTHPFAVRRVKELVAWVGTGEYDRIRSGDYPRRGHEPPLSEDFAASVAHYRERFSRFVDRTAGDVQRLSQQFGDWLKRRPGDEQGGDEAVDDTNDDESPLFGD